MTTSTPRRGILAGLVLVLTLMGTATTASAAELCEAPTPLPVPQALTTVGDGTAASCTEQVLRAAAGRGGRIEFDCGDDPVTIDVTSTIVVTKDAVIDGGGKVTLDGGGKVRIMQAADRTTSSFRNLTFVGGAAKQSFERSEGAGGAIAGMFRSHIEVIGSTFVGNSAGHGGGAVYGGVQGSTVIVGSQFRENWSWLGGAVYTLLSPLTIVNSDFEGNYTTTKGGLGDGGAIATDGAADIGQGGDVRICGATIKNNTGHGSGGGAYLWTYAPDRIVIEKTVFEGNEALPNGRNSQGIGGAARLSTGKDSTTPGSITVTDSRAVGNESGGNGGAFYVDCYATCDFRRSTVARNSSGGYGGAVFGDGHSSTDMLYAENTAAGHGGAFFGKGFTAKDTVFVANSAGNPWGQAMSCSETGTGSGVTQWGTGGPDTSTPCVTGATSADPGLDLDAIIGAPISVGAPQAPTEPEPVPAPAPADPEPVAEEEVEPEPTTVATAEATAAATPTPSPTASATADVTADDRSEVLAATGTSTRTTLTVVALAALVLALGTGALLWARSRGAFAGRRSAGPRH
ncbi:hypothetical protein [Cellulomonas sp. SLBN-39]|uniref:hypothetical protein n=1 Tax=Cellulomonas sp. SLBN-39 TaxID=2768446 RepID=UPI0011530A1B|nr:hypothetical protein [Cellulomonas sp. SLBN-39]TQL02702.1 putative outer membrane repeat protein [Cellulomonas sp. SLBN-39]